MATIKIALEMGKVEMSQIYIAAIIVSVILLLIFFPLIGWFNRWVGQKKLWVLLILSLPFSMIINLAVKGPIFNGLIEFLGFEGTLLVNWPPEMLALTLAIGGLAEEAIKIAPLIVPSLREICQQSQLKCLTIGWILGAGFGLGEAWYIAWQISLVPSLAGYPFYLYTGYISERVLVTFVHAAMTMIAIYGIYLRKGWWFPTYLAASFTHACFNIPALLYQIQVLDGFTTTLIVSITAAASILALLYIIGRLDKAEHPSNIEIIYQADC